MEWSSELEHRYPGTIRISISEILTKEKEKKNGRRPIPPIEYGIVLDHIKQGNGLEICSALELASKNVLIGLNYESKAMGSKDFIKIVGREHELTDDIIKAASQISPSVSYSTIKERQVAEKIRALLCENPECRSLEEGEDSGFYIQGEELRCAVCNTAHTSDIEGKDRYMMLLQEESVLGNYVAMIKDGIELLCQKHTLDGTGYDALKTRDDVAAEEKRYVKQAESLATVLNMYILEAFLFVGFDRNYSCRERDMAHFFKKALSRCGLPDSHSGNVVDDAKKYGKEHFFDKESGNIFRLKKHAELRRQTIINQFEQSFEPRPYVTSNMIRAIDEIVRN